MSSVGWYALLLLAVGLWRLVELVISARNRAWALQRGGVETGQGHFPAMAALHTALLVGCLVEVVVADRPFVPVLGWTMVAVLVVTQALRMWCMHALGRQWNTRVVVVPGMPRVTSGPYRLRWLPHPNYLVVVVEGLALPLVHTAWVTAVVFTVLNAVLLLRFRIPAEEAALARLHDARA
ncbi:hypothetical protein FHN55_12050 [Streptomyces sp. NP160]|uniref:isoprenylcysteine carboxyl methyltransferase family protein n=1 Tax=Streptomyces sp. NP160 TaxID=2586637 RepID=UPI001117C2AF|nr:isoprenylcysteine carboxylmethyltransferase family protein [Streptomyces sp. NP160]TNM66971.1 hypothetical protein FHN55_12050 [Streptomyces sp. NP160]